MKLKIQEFIASNHDWKEKLKEKPYCLDFDETDKYILFKYNQIESNFSDPLVRECRGLILEKGKFEAVCVPFFKFFNYGEGHADKIDFNTARVLEKIDGSIIKLWYHYGWKISTNGKIDASVCNLGRSLSAIFDGVEYNSFADVFKEAATKQGLDFPELNINYTYMFELVSPLNKVVVNYPNIKIYHIGTRNNDTFEELNIDIGIDKPLEYKFNTLEDCIESSKNLPYSEEGYVVVDAKWNRVKIKSPQYLAVHRLKNNGDVNEGSLLALAMKNEGEEFLTYFPEYGELFNKIRDLYERYISKIELDFNTIDLIKFENRKEYALYVKSACTNPSIMFAKADGKVTTVRKYFEDQDSKRLYEILKSYAKLPDNSLKDNKDGV